MGIKNCLKKTLPYIIALSIGTSLITGCKETKYEWQDKCERATISLKEYQPSYYDGLWCNWEDARYRVIIKCEHEGFYRWNTIYSEELYNKVEEGQAYKLPYKALVKLVYDDKDGDGKKELVESKEVRCRGHDFCRMEKLEK